MKKTVLLGGLFALITLDAQADIVCPVGPADCVKAETGHVTCTLPGGENWVFDPTEITLPEVNVHYSFTYVMSSFGVNSTKGACAYSFLEGTHLSIALFEANSFVAPDTALPQSQWKPWKIGYVCEASPGLCAFKPAN